MLKLRQLVRDRGRTGPGDGGCSREGGWWRGRGWGLRSRAEKLDFSRPLDSAREGGALRPMDTVRMQNLA